MVGHDDCVVPVLRSLIARCCEAECVAFTNAMVGFDEACELFASHGWRLCQGGKWYCPFHRAEWLGEIQGLVS